MRISGPAGVQLNSPRRPTDDERLGDKFFRELTQVGNHPPMRAFRRARVVVGATVGLSGRIGTSHGACAVTEGLGHDVRVSSCGGVVAFFEQFLSEAVRFRFSARPISMETESNLVAAALSSSFPTYRLPPTFVVAFEPDRSSHWTPRRVRVFFPPDQTMFRRVTAFVLLVAVTRVAAQPDAQAAAPAPDPSSPVLVADKEPPTVTASVEDEPFEEGDYDAFAPGPGPAPNDTLNCSTIEGITGNMPGVDLFYERTCDLHALQQRDTRTTT
jgi:hypothetical protein